jgi:hypothetical protein
MPIMTFPSIEELGRLRHDQESCMFDTGNIQPRVQTADSFGQPVETFPTDSADSACGLDMRPGSERFTPDMTVTTYDATLRLPITATPTVGDRFRITKRHGETLATALVFNIVSPIQRGPSGIRLLLTRIEE